MKKTNTQILPQDTSLPGLTAIREELHPESGNRLGRSK